MRTKERIVLTIYFVYYLFLVIHPAKPNRPNAYTSGHSKRSNRNNSGLDVYLQRIFPRIQDKSGVDDLSGQREHVERPVNEMIPVSGDVQTSQFVVAPRFVFDWKMYLFILFKTTDITRA